MLFSKGEADDVFRDLYNFNVELAFLLSNELKLNKEDHFEQKVE